MKHLARLTAVLVLASLALTSPAMASINLNSSRSNIYRVAHSTTLMTAAQAAAILADVRARDLDLGLVTSTFEVGSITGKLEADVLGLQLFGWSPVSPSGQLLSYGHIRMNHDIVVSGALYFADRRMKAADNCFRGFPALWNIIAFYLF